MARINKKSVSSSSGGTTSPGGSDKEIQFNDGGSFGADAGFVYDKTNNFLGINIASPLADIQLGSKGTIDGSTTAFEYSINGNCYRTGGVDKFIGGNGSGFAVKQLFDLGSNYIRFYFSQNGSASANSNVTWYASPSISFSGLTGGIDGTDGTNIYSLDATNGLSVNGNFTALADGSFGNISGSNMDASGNMLVTGTLTTVGGSDPPYELFFDETRLSVLAKVRKNVPKGRENGMVTFYNVDSNRMEFFKPKTGTWYIQAVNKDTGVIELIEDGVVDDGLPCFNVNVSKKFIWSKSEGNVLAIPIPTIPSINMPSDKQIDPITGVLVDKV